MKYMCISTKSIPNHFTITAEAMGRLWGTARLDLGVGGNQLQELDFGA